MEDLRKIKRIQLVVDEAVFERLKELKGDRSWEDFLVEAGLQYAEVLEKARKWDEVEPYLPKVVGHLLIEWLKKVTDHMFFKDEES